MSAKNLVSKPSSLPKEGMKDAIVRHLHCSLGTDENKADKTGTRAQQENRHHTDCNLHQMQDCLNS